MLGALVAQIAAGIFFTINYDVMMDKGLTESMRGVNYTSLHTFWDELQKDVRSVEKWKQQIRNRILTIII